jgi:hypothetical protein
MRRNRGEMYTAGFNKEETRTSVQNARRDLAVGKGYYNETQKRYGRSPQKPHVSRTQVERLNDSDDSRVRPRLSGSIAGSTEKIVTALGITLRHTIYVRSNLRQPLPQNSYPTGNCRSNVQQILP